MARTIAPLLSFSASGQIAKTQVYSIWKGRPYVRRYTTPTYTNTDPQKLTRNTFRWLNDAWRYLPAGALGAWDIYADSSQFTARNGWIKQNLRALRLETVITDLIVSPPARGGIVAAGLVATGASEKISVTLTAPLLPEDWSITAAHALAIPQQDPQTDSDMAMGYATDTMTPFEFDIEDLTPTVEYLVGAWFQYQRPDGKAAYGIALTDLATATA